MPMDSSTNDAPLPVGDPLAFIPKATPRLRASVEKQRKILPPADFREMMGVIRSVFEKYLAKLKEFAPGVERANALHRMLDVTQEPTAGLNISCRMGCSGCCHYEIEITDDEAVLLASVVRGGVEIDRERLAKQATRARKGPEWEDILQPDNRCVFLAPEGVCRIYELRPSACRRHLVTTPAEWCTTPGKPVAPVEVLMTEILLSAATSLDGSSFASLSKMLTATLAAESA